MTPKERNRYEKVLTFFREHEKCLVAGMSGDAAARVTHEAFEAIPNPLRDVLAREGVGAALHRIQGAGGPLADLVDRVYKRCKADPQFKRREAEFWEVLGDHLDVEDEEEEEEDKLGDSDDEGSVPVERGGVKGSPGSHVGGVKEWFVYPDEIDSGTEETVTEESPEDGATAIEDAPGEDQASVEDGGGEGEV